MKCQHLRDKKDTGHVGKSPGPGTRARVPALALDLSKSPNFSNIGTLGYGPCLLLLSCVTDLLSWHFVIIFVYFTNIWYPKAFQEGSATFLLCPHSTMCGGHSVINAVENDLHPPPAD